MPLKTSSSPALICVVIPTFRRHKGLLAALDSISAQTFSATPGPHLIDIIVCDNSPEASAKDLVSAFCPVKSQRLIYLHEPNTGVANARNKALSHVTAPLLAFLDDDECAPNDWLDKMMRAQKELEADIVFGPVKARLPEDVIKNKAYFESFFSRIRPEPTRLINDYYGCGNSLLKMSILPKDRPVFSIERNDIGGEDDLLFHELKQAGARMAWAHDAFVYEDVPSHRATLSYTLKRAFAYGQGPSQSAMSARPPKPLTCVYWMAQGLIQGLMFSLIGGALSLIGHDRSAYMLDKAVRGFGKTFWGSTFKIKFYGSSLNSPSVTSRLSVSL